MIRKLEIYNPTKTYIFPNLKVAQPEVIQSNYQIVNLGKCVIETDITGRMFYSVEFLDSMKNRLGVADGLSDEESIIAMEEILNAPEPEPMPTTEERIAAALEYQNLTSM